ncbi:MAG: hypothetical protein LUE64_01680 [Candidatus Gastranaerophilales bacterium]|nr:hypothetical protein [Candidatus Gastranaerophilales bacterium]
MLTLAHSVQPFGLHIRATEIRWGCRCYVVNLTKHEAKKEGIKVETSEGKIEPATVIAGGETKETQSFNFDHDSRREGEAGVSAKGRADEARHVRATVDDRRCEQNPKGEANEQNSKGILTGGRIKLTPDAGWGTNLGIKAWGIDVQAWNKVENMPDSIKYQFISKMAENPHNKAVFENMIEKLVANGFKAQKIEKTLCWITPELFKKLDEVKIKNPIVVFQEQKAGHIIGERQKLSKDELKGIYEILNKPDGIYYDYTSGNETNLAFTKDIPKSDECIKVCVKLTKKSKISGDTVNYVTTAGKVKKTEMNDKRHFKKIE